MGINDLLPRVLPSAGRADYDLRSLADGMIDLSPDHPDDPDRPPKRPRGDGHHDGAARHVKRKARIAVDVNGWISRASHGHGSRLVDGLHLTYHGRGRLAARRRAGGDGGDVGQGEDQEPTDAQLGRAEGDARRSEFVDGCVSFVLGRIEGLRDGCNARVLTVLDGATPPAKREAVRERSDRRKRAEERREADGDGGDRPASPSADRGDEAARTEAEVLRRISASKRAGAGGDQTLRREVIGRLLSELKRRRWPFLVAPYEADGQLAYLARGGGVDLVVTEDSDLIGHGCPALCYKLDAPARAGDGGREAAPGEDGGACPPPRLRGTLLLRENLGSSHRLDLRDFSDAMTAVTFVAAGCDYADSLKGIGIVTARDIVHGAFASRGGGGRGEEEDDGVPVLLAVLRGLYRSCHREARSELLPLDDPSKEGARRAYESTFLAGLAMFRHPVVYDPLLGEDLISNDVGPDGGDRSGVDPSFLRDELLLMEHGPYRDLVTDRTRLTEVVGRPFGGERARGVAGGVLDPRALVRDAEIAGWLAADFPGEDGGDEDDDEDGDGGGGGGEADEDESLGLGTQADGSSAAGSGARRASGARSTQSSGSGARTRRSSASGGMISSLSPDLLASSQSQTPSRAV